MKIISTPRPTTTASRTVVLIRSYLDGDHSRSEEHTSELQSHLNLVCRLLLEKKKTPSPPAESLTEACSYGLPRSGRCTPLRLPTSNHSTSTPATSSPPHPTQSSLYLLHTTSY